MESRGRLTSVVGPLPVCRIMIVSVSSEVSLPVASSAFCSSVRLLRLSEPTISQLVPRDAGPSAGSAYTRVSVVSTYTPNATTSKQQGQQDPADPEPAEARHPRWPARSSRAVDGAGRATVGR